MKNWIIAALVAALALSLVAGVVAQGQGQAQRTATVQLRLWESSADPSENYISIRDDNGRWTPDTPPLLLDDGLSPDGRYRYGDLTIESTVPDPDPLGLEVTDTSCYRGQFNAYLTLHGWVRNVTDATLSNVVITAALRDRTGVEVAQGAAIVLHGISPWGKRPFAISFFSAAGARGTCHLLGVTYDASVRFDSPSPGQAPR